jgi:hypothetical protein
VALHSDSEPLLNDIEQAQLWLALQQPPPDGGLWNGRKVADWMSSGGDNEAKAVALSAF